MSTTSSRSWVDPLQGEATEFEERLGHHFGDRDLLAHALTHSSWCAEHPGSESNERLELLGDAVLGLAVAERCYRRYPEMNEGALAQTRSAVVRGSTLVIVAEEVGLGEELRLGKGELTTGGRSKPSLLSDGLEAVLGAVFLDAGYPAASGVVGRLFGDLIDDVVRHGPEMTDLKTHLQELAVERFGLRPSYTMDSSGPEHEPVFVATVSVGAVELGEGRGRSKKSATQAAAQEAIRRLAAEQGQDRAGDRAGEGGD